MALDVKNFYYNNPMDIFEYMFLPLNIIPNEIVDQYNLQEMSHDGKVYMEIQKGMPGLKQAGIIANERLQQHLLQYGYAPVPRTPALWRHSTRNIAFSLVVDDFGVQYTGKSNAQHLIDALQTSYSTINVDWTGQLYCGINIQWDYKKRIDDISMPKYITAMLIKY